VQPLGRAPFAGIGPEMVRVTGVAAAVVACWACAPAQAGTVGVELPAASAPQVSVPAAEQVANDVTPVVRQVTDRLPAVPTTTTETLRKTTAAAQPAVDAAVETTTSTAQVARGRAGGSGGLRVGASSLRRAPPARLRHPAHSAPAAPKATRAHPPLTARPASPAGHAAPAGGGPADHRTSARPDRSPHAPPPPGAAAEGGISAGSAFAGGLAVLAAALMLTAPRLRRRLWIDPVALRPVAFVALLERPG
jgi:hypothetical protein